MDSHRSREQHPPRLAELLLRLTVRDADASDGMLGDLREEYRGLLGEGEAPSHPRLWFWLAIIGLSGRFILAPAARAAGLSGADRRAGVSVSPTSIGSLLGGIAEDTSYALRRFRKSPGYATIAIATIAIGVGANTAIFSVLDAVILKPLPFPEPEQLVQIWETNPQYVAWQNQANADVLISHLGYDEYSDQNCTLSGLEYVQNWDDGKVTIAGGDRAPELVEARSVSASFFSVLGIHPVLGREFLPEDDTLGAGNRDPRLAILTHDIWVRRHGADPDIIGKRISLVSSPVTVVGVLPEGFAFPPISSNGDLIRGDVDVYVPATIPRDLGNGYRRYAVLGRTAPGTSVEEVRTDFERILSGSTRAYPEIMLCPICSTKAGWSVGVTPLREIVARDFGADLYLLMGIVGFVLLIACVNLAHLLLAMGSRRKAELAVRIAIGGSRRRQIQLLLTESLLLSVLGGVAGLVAARLGLGALLELVPANVPRAAEAGLDGRVLAFTVGLSLATGLLFGLLPALRASDVNLVEGLKGTKSAGSHGHRLASSTPLLVIQVALTLMLLVGGSVLGKSFFQLRAVDRGYRAENVLVMEMQGGRDVGRQRNWSDAYRLLETLGTIPGVLSAASGEAPLTPAYRDWIQFREYEDIEHSYDYPTAEMIMSYTSWISPGYFETLGIPIIRGEGLPEWDGVNDWRRYNWRTRCWPDPAPKICSEQAEFGKVVVSESFAAAAWPGQDPIGKDLGYSGCCWTVAGVVPDVNHLGVLARPMTYSVDLPNTHQIYYSFVSNRILVRTIRDPMLIVPAIREAILSMDDMLSIEVSTMEGRVHDALARPRFHMLIGGIFAAVALLLALVGLYGVVAYTVAQRTHEIGVRIALGAQREDIRALVVRNGLMPVGLGVVLGIAGVLASARVLEALLYGMSALDPSLIPGLSAMLVVVTALACYVPARRASAVDPVLALSHE